MRKINTIGVELIKEFEGFKHKPYLCPANIPTIGYGATFYEDQSRVTLLDQPISEQRATVLLQNQLSQFEQQVEKIAKSPLNENEFSALVCFCFNVGPSQLEKSTLMKLLNSNADHTAVADQFLRWNKAGGKELSGLTRRRQAERSLFLQPMNNELPDGPSEEDINKKLDNIEKDILK